MEWSFKSQGGCRWIHIMDAHRSHRWCPWFNSLLSLFDRDVKTKREREREYRRSVSPQHMAEQKRAERSKCDGWTGGGGHVKDMEKINKYWFWNKRRQWHEWMRGSHYNTVSTCRVKGQQEHAGHMMGDMRVKGQSQPSQSHSQTVSASCFYSTFKAIFK